MKFISKIIWPLFFTVSLLGCDTTPKIIPDTTGDSAVMLSIKKSIENQSTDTTGYGWLFWYAPVALIALLWAYREFIRKPLLCDDGDVKDEPEDKKEDNS
jgi:cytochrome bd-type quinol oxidase subunit 2